GTDRELDDVMMTLTPALELAGHRVLYDKTEIKTEELATQYKFLSSPTIRVNGKDICMSVKENDCNCCSDIGGTDVDCRIFEYEGREYEIPPKEMLASAILKIASGADAAAKGGGSEGSCSCSCGDYKLPDNLKNFFDGKEKVNCACEGDSCCG
ncbi:MAG: DUF2703 domain-containing protein, partial [Eubacteriales bacterium]|nr:DUF2703 domain-containing protein [Eubacteriales bacterium]